MRILHLLSQTELTGAEVYAKNLIDHQHANGHEIFVISEKMHVKLAVDWHSLPLSSSNKLRQFFSILKLRKFLQKNKIEIIHCHSRGAVRHAHWARLFLPTAMTTTLHGRQHPSLSKRLLNIYGEILVAVCPNVKLSTVQSFNLHPDSIEVLPNPVMIAHDPTTTQAKSMALIGRSTGPKGRRFESLAKFCFEKWLQQIENLKIDIIVPSPNKFSKEFLALITELNNKYQDRIKLVGHIQNLNEQMKHYELIIASGRIAMEALLQKVSLLAFGEYHQLGIVSTKNWQECIDSNFGDMGADKLEIPLDPEKTYLDVISFFKGSTNIDDKNLLQQWSQNYFSPQRINSNILEIYQRCIFKRQHPKWIPVLMYHKIPDQEIQSQHRIFVTKDNFERHLQFFKNRGFTTLTLADIGSFMWQKKSMHEFPTKPLVLTFDDGYRDNLRNAQPLLQKYQMKATIFLLANHHILENSWDTQTGDSISEIMPFNEKLKLDKNTWEIASHGFDHLRLPEVSAELAKKEITESKIKLESEFKQPIFSFAYPFGVRSDAVAELTHQAAYKFAVNTDQGALHLADAPYSIFRVNIFPEDSNFALWKKTSPWYRKYFYRKRKR